MTLEDVDVQNLEGKTVLVRVDFNAPMLDGQITDDTRIRATLPTIQTLQKAKAKIVLCSHAGRPKGKTVPEFSLRPMAERLDDLLRSSPAQEEGSTLGVRFSGSCSGDELATLIQDTLLPGEVLLLENLRFHPGETGNAEDFAAEILDAVRPHLFVNDAFGTAHRAHASTEGIPRLLRAGGRGTEGGKVLCVAGKLFAAELKFLYTALENPKRPFTAIVGGAKVKNKLPLLKNLIEKVDHLLIGGAMAFTFLKARGITVGDSLVEEEFLGEAEQLLKRAGEKILLPKDVLLAERFAEDAPFSVLRIEEEDAGAAGALKGMALDIGPETVQEFTNYIQRSGTVVWNGSMGVNEWKSFASGTAGVAKALKDASLGPGNPEGAVTIVGGGDTVSAVTAAGCREHMTHISTGGGAMLEVLQGLDLPGISVLDDFTGVPSQ